MEDAFQLSVYYNNQPLEFETVFQRWGYTHRFRVLVNEVPVFFEPDEEGGYRAVVTDVPETERRKLDPFLLKCIAETIRESLE